jgi:small-conductance mechanosensitive channel
MKLLYDAWYANSLSDWGAALAIAFIALLAFALLRSVLARVVRAVSARTATRLDDSLVEVVRATRLALLVPLALYLGSLALELPQRLGNILVALATVTLLVQAALWINRFVRAYIDLQVERRRADGDTVTALGLLGFVAKVVVWALILLLILDQLNFDITALVAGLGIGGIAVALAVQNILGDLFASLSILLDKPFVVGDFIIVGDEMGTVEQVGVKTTRVRSLGGELIVFSNADLLKSRIRNYKRMYERRVVFSFGLVYDTTDAQIERAVAVVRESITAQKKTRFDRAHFKGYGDSSLDFEVVYFVLDPDFNLYMDIQQAINLDMLRIFRAEGIEFAYPTRTLYVANGGEASPGGQPQPAAGV